MHLCLALAIKSRIEGKWFMNQGYESCPSLFEKIVANERVAFGLPSGCLRLRSTNLLTLLLNLALGVENWLKEIKQ